MSAIDDIEDRLQDLIEALRGTGAPGIADMLERYAHDFTEPTLVRRSVNAVRAHLEHWRADPSELPDSPKVMHAANRLEDACREALAAGVIAAAPPTLAAQSRRKLMVVLTTLLVAGLVALGAIAFVASGVDVNDVGAERKLPALRLPRGDEGTAPLSVLVDALVPEAVTGVVFEPLGGCKETLPGDATCADTAPRLWSDGRLPTFEIKLPHQAYGLLFSITEVQVEHKRFGVGKLLLAATDDTPEGRYEIPLTAAYAGYTPQHCELTQRLQNACPKPRTGAEEKHTGLRVPTVVVDVVPGDPAERLGEKRRKQAEAEEAQRKADERAAEIATALTEIRAVLDQTQKLINRRHWEEARANVQKLGLLFQPLDGVVLTQIGEGGVPEVGQVRARYEKLRDEMDAFEQRVFEQTYKAVTAESNRRVPEDSLLARLGKQLGISPGYVQEIYTERADEIQRRLDARNKAHMDELKAAQEARERRCGPLPKAAWDAVNRYVRAVYAEPHVEIELGECMTPRLTERDCWEMRCDFKRKEEVAVERPKVVTSHEATFYLVDERVVRHHDG